MGLENSFVSLRLFELKQSPKMAALALTGNSAMFTINSAQVIEQTSFQSGKVSAGRGKIIVGKGTEDSGWEVGRRVRGRVK